MVNEKRKERWRKKKGRKFIGFFCETYFMINRKFGCILLPIYGLGNFLRKCDNLFVR